MKVKTTDMVWGVSSVKDLYEYKEYIDIESLGWNMTDSERYFYDTVVKIESLRSELIKELLNV